jgi:hypothetical protein
VDYYQQDRFGVHHYLQTAKMAKLNGQWRLNDSVSFKEVGTQNEAASQSASATPSASASPFVGHWQGSSDGDEMYLNVTKEGDIYKMDVDSTGGIAVEGTFVGQTMGNGQLSMDPPGLWRHVLLRR